MSTLQEQDAPSSSAINNPTGDTGENSNDECCLCGKEWTPDQPGWPLCDTPDCPNTVCAPCAQMHELSVSELFYCPPCAGSGLSAAATVGGAMATAVAALSSVMDQLPMSQATLRTILKNLQEHPTEPKFRRLRLENKSIQSYIDLEPVRRILASIGFCQKEELRQKPKSGYPPTEQVLVLEGDVDVELVKELADVMDGLSSHDGGTTNEEAGESSSASRNGTTMEQAAVEGTQTTESNDKEEETAATTTKMTSRNDVEKEERKWPSKKAKHS